MVSFAKATSTFWLLIKSHSTSDNSGHTSSCGHADRAISIISMSLREEPIGLAWAVECTDFSKILCILEAGEGQKLAG